MARRIQLRRDTLTNWQTANTVLAQGEVGVDLTNNKIKIGNGSTSWSDLEYLADETGAGANTGNVQFIDDEIFTETGRLSIYSLGAGEGDYNRVDIETDSFTVDVTQDINLTAGTDLELTVNNAGGGAKTFTFANTGALTLPDGGVIRETVVTENPTIELEPANAEVGSQKLIVKGGGPTYSNEENGITVSTGTLTVAESANAYFWVSASTYAGNTFYWWVDNYSPDDKFDPDTGTITLDEFGYASFEFTVLDASVPLIVYVSDTLYNAYVNNVGAASVLVNGTIPDLYHLHLTTGDLQETSVFLGTDNHNVRTRIDGSIEVTAYNYDNESSATWNFSNGAVLTFPSADFDGENSILPRIYFPIPETSGGYFGVNPYGIGVQVLDSMWSFVPEVIGEGSSPAALRFPDDTLQLTAWAGGRVVEAPDSSNGAMGDLSSDIAFTNQHLYYCTADYTDGQSAIWKRIAWSNDTW